MAVTDDLVIREPQSAEDLIALHMLRLVQGEEMAQAPVNPEKVIRRIVEAAQHPETNIMLMAVKDGRLVGYLLLERCTYDYADADYLIDWGFYVLPRHRGADVGPALLRDARDIAEQAGLPLYVIVNNPSRRRGARSGLERAASVIGFMPHGAVLAFKESADVLRQEQTNADADIVGHGRDLGHQLEQ
jgi:GNAT superfamily N-acetyltransferase